MASTLCNTTYSPVKLSRKIRPKDIIVWFKKPEIIDLRYVVAYYEDVATHPPRGRSKFLGCLTRRLTPTKVPDSSADTG